MQGFDNWLLMALLAPVAWSLCCLIDTCLVGKKILKTASDGAVISGLFSVVPVVMIMAAFRHQGAAQELVDGASDGTVFAILSGLGYFLHIYCYFKALFKLNDASGTELFLSLTVVLVPVFAFVVLGEQLGRNHYLAILVAAIALIILCRASVKLKGNAAIVYLSLSVIAAALSMVFQAKALALSSFTDSTLWFNSSILIVSLVFLAFSRTQRQRIAEVVKSMGALMLLAELLEIFGRFSAQRAIELGPSVSLVALIECLLPVLVMALSFSIVGVDRKLSVLPMDLKETFALQLEAVGPKVVAMGLILGSIVIAQPI